MSCSDDEASLQPSDNYTPMAIGNYWVYQTNITKLDGTAVSSAIDSVVISGDSIIDGNNYYVFEGTNFISNDWRILALRRVDGDNLVDPEGLTHFSSTNFSDTLYRYRIEPDNDKWISVDYQMNNPIDQITVPAGSFDVLDFRGVVQTNISTPYPLPKFAHNYRASDVGLVLRNTFAFTTGYIVEERLMRYSIKN